MLDPIDFSTTLMFLAGPIASHITKKLLLPIENLYFIFEVCVKFVLVNLEGFIIKLLGPS